jgi:ABC-type proline/glycine betaine transport system permease subunit
MFGQTLITTLGAVVILMLIAFIIGLVIGVSMARPNIVR